ncbi:asparagine-tRNA ligase [Blattabacterium sp. (Blattella germanica) str. Bge]|uniref:asparagine--tRNA ligase n=1 Tax=Blattabacterium sp. (Blattella germanica) TaxID=624186 RepID=UPI0001BB60CB|nr:asparagine--tRNA ligase [Blattabacterium sp. (Blattella germanica)]ACY40149.1 asparagine-tRNA ligase [Blattabacterium sp. (Blattella germanica) str. Bge]
MIKKYSIKELLDKGKFFINKKVLVEGWIRSFRYSIFITLNDGSTIRNLQIILSKKLEKEIQKKITIGSSIQVIGIITESIGKKQSIELQSLEITIYGSVDPSILQKSILQPKRHSFEKLRKQAHLRFRTNIFSCIMRIRHHMAFCIHQYFHENGFFYLHTPIITTSNCEGSGKMFQITTMDLKENSIDYTKDFFKCKTYLSVSGQLEAETAALGLGKVYTFGPVFRAENSNTSRHLSEFWMIEPEIAFFHLEENINLAEDFLKFIIRNVLDKNMEDLLFLNEFLKKWRKKEKEHLLDKLELILKFSFKRISYTEAVKILIQEEKKQNIKFFHPVVWGMDLQSEHEQYLVNKYKIPVIVFDYPSCIKAFYMRINNDGKTVRAMDILFPEIGEVIGGSQREERYEILLQRIKDTNTDKNKLWWYLDTRRFGSVPHSGFGLGFDRLVQFITGMNNIRDVIPFPRTPNNAEF